MASLKQIDNTSSEVEYSVILKSRKTSNQQEDEIIYATNNCTEHNFFKKEVKKLCEILSSRRKAKVKFEVQEKSYSKEKEEISRANKFEENIYENIHGSFAISTQTHNLFENKKSLWRKSFGIKKNKHVENFSQRNKEQEINNITSYEFSRTPLRKTCANTRRSFKKINLKNKRKSVAVASDTSLWNDTIMTQDSNVSFQEKVQKLKKIFKEGIKVFKREQVTEL